MLWPFERPKTTKVCNCRKIQTLFKFFCELLVGFCDSYTLLWFWTLQGVKTLFFLFFCFFWFVGCCGGAATLRILLPVWFGRGYIENLAACFVVWGGDSFHLAGWLYGCAFLCLSHCLFSELLLLLVFLSGRGHWGMGPLGFAGVSELSLVVCVPCFVFVALVGVFLLCVF